MKTKLIYLLIALTPLFTISCSKDNLPIDEQQDTATEISMEVAEELEYLEEQEAKDRSHSYFTFRTLNQALHCTGLNAALFSGKKTIYAPSDAAFEKLGLNRHNICDALDTETLTAILLYHVAGRIVKLNEKGCVELLDGNIAQLKRDSWKRFINDSRIYLAWQQKGHDYKLRVYAITDVLMPPTDNIVTTASGAEMFSSLVSAVLAADPGIATALSNEDAIYTVFAPTNQAFADLIDALGVGDLNGLVSAIGVEALSTVLLYHVADACAFSNNLADGLEVATLQGETVEVDLDNLSLIDKTGTPSALVVEGLDILTSNGVVHTIDKVLLPQVILDAL